MYRIEEFGEVIADACLRDSEGRFLFLSVFGRDNALLQFLAAMELPREQHGIQRFHLLDEHGQRAPADVGGTDRLTKHTGRLPKQNIFGPLNQVWIHDKALVAPDIVNRIAWVLHYGNYDGAGREADPDSLHRRTWAMLKRLSPVPLLDDWREPVVDWARASGALRPAGEGSPYPPLGPVRGMRVSLEAGFLQHVSHLVRAGVLRLPDQAAPVIPASRRDAQRELRAA